jgi:hypothetical protein
MIMFTTRLKTICVSCLTAIYIPGREVLSLVHSQLELPSLGIFPPTPKVLLWVLQLGK